MNAARAIMTTMYVHKRECLYVAFSVRVLEQLRVRVLENKLHCPEMSVLLSVLPFIQGPYTESMMLPRSLILLGSFEVVPREALRVRNTHHN